MTSLLFAILLSLNTVCFALDTNSSVSEAVEYIENQFNSENYKIDESSNAIKLLFLKEWPEDALLGLQLAILDADYSISDSDQIGALIDYVDPTGEYWVRGQISRSLEVNLASEKIYAAVYYVFGGEWGREEDFRRYFIVDAKGNLLTSGQVR